MSVGAFDWDITEVDIPAKVSDDGVIYMVTSLTGAAFTKCGSLKSITIPSGVTSIEDAAFYFCENLTSVSISDTVTSIGKSVFRACKNLTSITIPKGVTSLGEGFIAACDSLTSITVDSGNSTYCAVDSVLYSKDMKTLIVCATGKTGSVEIPSGVISIEKDAFSSCMGLTSITIPNGVTSIEKYAFEACSSLTAITIPSSVDKIGSDCFIDCSKLTSITFENTADWCQSSRGYSGGTVINVTNPATNASNMKNSRGSWHGCYLYRR